MFVRSSSAWSGILTIVGTLVGFAGGIYLPMDSLSTHVQAVLKCLPVLHGASMMRKVCTEEAVAETFLGLPENAGELFRECPFSSDQCDCTDVWLLFSMVQER